ncbi:hypothetical protein JB92DRAFT_3065740 [Gautieria morchelliformis]|nr:hypothetical protein JB92DRAFT_3065740 [Gautieria morchelliformis]
MEHTARAPLSVPDYSNFYGGCDYCGAVLAHISKAARPMPCPVCNIAHYCSPRCLMLHFRGGHKAQCYANLDAEIDVQGAAITTKSQALWDLRKYTQRWHDELGDAAIAAMNLHADATAMDKGVLVVQVSYLPRQPYRMQRFRFQSAMLEPMSSLSGTCADAALRRRQENSIINKRNGMVGCALILLACDVPGVGFVYNSTFIGPEPSVLADKPPVDWENRLWLALSKNTRS